MTPAHGPRLDHRARLRVSIDVTPRWLGASCVAMETVDLSVSGAVLSSPINLPLKTQVAIRLLLPALAGLPEMEVACEAVVVSVEEMGRARDQWRAGLYFLDMRPSDQMAMRRFIFAAVGATRESGHAGAAPS